MGNLRSKFQKNQRGQQVQYEGALQRRQRRNPVDPSLRSHVLHFHQKVDCRMNVFF
jgi:hypothetical protein